MLEQYEPRIAQPRHAVYIGRSGAGLEWRSEQDAQRSRRIAASGEQPLGHTKVDVLVGRKQPGICVRIAGPSQLVEAPVEKLGFGEVVPLLLSGGHSHT